MLKAGSDKLEVTFPNYTLVMLTGTHLSGMGKRAFAPLEFFGHGQTGICPFGIFRVWALDMWAQALKRAFFKKNPNFQ